MLGNVGHDIDPFTRRPLYPGEGLFTVHAFRLRGWLRGDYWIVVAVSPEGFPRLFKAKKRDTAINRAYDEIRGYFEYGLGKTRKFKEKRYTKFFVRAVPVEEASLRD